MFDALTDPVLGHISDRMSTRFGRRRPYIAIGSNLPATLILYYVTYVLQSNMADALLLPYFVTGILFLPAWIRLARITGKSRPG